MKQHFMSPVILVTILMFTSCASLEMTEERHYNELVHEGIIDKPIEHKNVWIAGSLDFIIPGVGHYYLGEWESGNGLLVSNIFWPLSPVWGTLSAITDTENTNKRYTLEHYLYGSGKPAVTKMKKEKCYQAASEYIQLQKQIGRNEFTKGELFQYLVIQNIAPDYINTLDLENLQSKTDCRIIEKEKSKTVTEPVIESEE